MKKSKTTRGGRRAGAGRRSLPKNERQITRSFCIHPVKSQALDVLKGGETLGSFLVKKLKL